MEHISNRRLNTILISGICIVILTLIINIAIFKIHQLDKPVFFEHYFEKTIYNNSDNMLFIHYITNKKDDRKIVDITFPELENHHIDLEVKPFFNDSYYQLKYYNIHRVPISFEWDENISADIDEDIILDDAFIMFNNGETLEVNIGEIRLYNGSKYKRSDALDVDFSSSSSDHASISRIKVLKPILIQNISSAFMDQTKDIVKLKVDLPKRDMLLEDIHYPLTLERDSRITFSSQFQINEKDMRKYNFYEMVEQIHLKNLEEDKDEFFYIYNISYEPYFNDKMIENFLKSKGALK